MTPSFSPLSLQQQAPEPVCLYRSQHVPASSRRDEQYSSALSRSPYASSFNRLQEYRLMGEFASIIHYQNGQCTYYNMDLDVLCIDFVDYHVRNAYEAKQASKMLYQDIMVLFKEQGLGKVGILTDLSGLNVDGGLTAVWGDQVKKHMDAYCKRLDNKEFIFVSYFSRPIRDDQEYIKRKKMEVQIKTEASLHNFQCNLCPTRRDAIEYYRYLSSQYHC